MGHDYEVYFLITISPLPGNPQFLPLDKIFPSLKKYAFLMMCRCKCGAGAPARVSVSISTAHVATGDSPVPFKASAVT